METTSFRLVCGALGLALALSAATKLHDRYAFLRAVIGWRVFSLQRGRLFARTFPHLELILGLALSVAALLGSPALRFVLPVVAAFATALVAGHMVVYRRARGRPCGCGDGGRIGGASLAKASGFAALAIAAAALIGSV